tara:strand:+ start:928 stop:1587 length:660 start_codon:yes stop_codon:yes gene_type:complete
MNPNKENNIEKKKHKIIGIVDRSGSMRYKENDTIGGINTTFEQLRNDKQEDEDIDVSIKLFDHEEIMVIRSENIDNVKPFTREDFIPRGTTSLLDAIGNTLNWIMQQKIMNPDFYDTCLIFVATDGEENSSKIYNSNQIEEMIKESKKNYNIEFLYLGANQDSILNASKLGISSQQAMNYSETQMNVECAYRALSNVAKRYRSTGSADFTENERLSSQY